jgi:hypothetical protein
MKDSAQLKTTVAGGWVFGAVERGGRVRVRISPDTKAKSIYSFLDRNVNPPLPRRS